MKGLLVSSTPMRNNELKEKMRQGTMGADRDRIHGHIDNKVVIVSPSVP